MRPIDPGLAKDSVPTGEGIIRILLRIAPFPRAIREEVIGAGQSGTFWVRRNIIIDLAVTLSTRPSFY